MDNVMDLARLNAGTVQLSTEPIRLIEVAREAIHLLTSAAEAKSQALRIGSSDDVVVTGDHARLRQVLVNLIDNAVKFTPQDGTIALTISRCDAGGIPMGEVRVSDTGPGIAEAEQAAIYDPYYRSEGTAEAPGVGLGLAISRGLMQQMGGELGLESEVGAGSSFFLQLPLADEAADVPSP